ncbi:MBL fold metallo-hydrolase [Pedobacter miscanthi]|uniref:MBL fold metallo-hydrolase n=1 Tax=Pedobacter miscanthi TaxID=2259170 RepID=A0A366KLU7_9SPHI|nr:MBL fold metallo-hydrolase [Pedobacter miscanthi]RBQ02243.1 MBL fold metallo-hydrolase [Pedobacter miscanthi]
MRRFLKILRNTFLSLLVMVLVLAIITFFYMRQPQFGASPEGERLARIEKSPHYKDGKFHNQIEKPTIAEGYTIAGEIYSTLFKHHPRTSPVDVIPSVKTNLFNIPLDSNVLVWFGHSSSYIQLDGKRILIDPVFSKRASPLPWGPKAYKGSNIYTAADIPPVDYLIISHDHYDHLDYQTIVALKDKVKQVICGLGVGAHFEYWGYPAEKLIEKDWDEQVEVGDNYTIYTAPTHHESSRGLISAKTLWMSYIIQSPTMKIYYSGDGGYDNHYADAGKKFGPIDLAIIESGQYDKAWRSVHNLPEDVLQAAKDLKAKRILPVHNSKFTLGKHPWDEPLIKISALAKANNIPLASPMIGEVVYLNNRKQPFKQWWLGVN